MGLTQNDISLFVKRFYVIIYRVALDSSADTFCVGEESPNTEPMVTSEKVAGNARLRVVVLLRGANRDAEP